MRPGSGLNKKSYEIIRNHTGDDMPRGGNRDSAGRKPGSRNRKTEEQIQAVIDGGMTPLEYLLSVMRNDAVEQGDRIEAAKAAAPYVHPKLSQVEMNSTAKITQVISADPITEAEWEKQYGDLESAAGTAESIN